MPTHHINDTMSTTTSSAMSSQFQHSINNSEDVTSTMNITTPCIDEQHAKYTSYEQHVHSNEDDTMNMQQYASKATGIFGSNVITEHQQHPKTYAESSSSSRAVMAPHHHLPTILAPILSSNSSSNSASDTTLSNSALPRDTNKIHHDTCIHYTDDKDDKATWVFASKKGQENDQYLLFSVDHSKQELSMSHQVRFLYYSLFESGGGLTTVFLNTYIFSLPLVSGLLSTSPFLIHIFLFIYHILLIST